MRRSDREVTDINKINDIIKTCTSMRIGLNDNGKVYIVPLNFGHEYDNGVHTFYFHGAKEGRKIDILSHNNEVGFQMDANYLLQTGDNAHDYTAAFECIIGSGKVYFVEDKNQKIEVLNKIMAHHTKQDKWEYPDAMLNQTCIFKLVVDELSCKVHL